MNSESKHLLGRHKDPRVPSDIGPWSLLWRKTLWNGLEFLGSRRVTPKLFTPETVCFYDVNEHPGTKGYVAFTVDDGFCGMDNPGGDMTREVADLFTKYDSKATFFITATHTLNVEPDAVEYLLAGGHELANHGTEDRPYHMDSREEFARDLNETDRAISRFQKERVPWYRAPHARFSKSMEEELTSRNMTHVMVDAFANDTAIPDPEWIAKTVLNNVTDGSVLLVHMPERGVREWNLEAMELVLQGIRAKGLQSVTFTELHERARKNGTSAD